MHINSREILTINTNQPFYNYVRKFTGFKICSLQRKKRSLNSKTFSHDTPYWKNGREPFSVRNPSVLSIAILKTLTAQMISKPLNSQKYYKLVMKLRKPQLAEAYVNRP